MFKTENNLAHL